MGFVDDLWTALLSDEEVETQDALDRLGEDDAVAKAAAATLWADDAGGGLCAIQTKAYAVGRVDKGAVDRRAPRRHRRSCPVLGAVDRADEPDDA